MQAPITLSANMLSINSSSKKRPLASVSGRSNTNYMSIQRLQGLLLTACRSGGGISHSMYQSASMLSLSLPLRIHHPHHRRSHLRTRLQIHLQNHPCNQEQRTCKYNVLLQLQLQLLQRWQESKVLENNSFNFAILIKSLFMSFTPSNTYMMLPSRSM